MENPQKLPQSKTIQQLTQDISNLRQTITKERINNTYINGIDQDISSLQKEISSLDKDLLKVSSMKNRTKKEINKLSSVTPMKSSPQRSQQSSSKRPRFRKKPPESRAKELQSKLGIYDQEMQELNDKKNEYEVKLSQKVKELTKEINRLAHQSTRTNGDIILGMDNEKGQLTSLLKKMNGPPKKLILFSPPLQKSQNQGEYTDSIDNYRYLYFLDNQLFHYRLRPLMVSTRNKEIGRSVVSTELEGCTSITPLNSLFSICEPKSASQNNYSGFLDKYITTVPKTIIMDQIGDRNTFLKEIFPKDLQGSDVILDIKPLIQYIDKIVKEESADYSEQQLILSYLHNIKVFQSSSPPYVINASGILRDYYKCKKGLTGGTQCPKVLKEIGAYREGRKLHVKAIIGADYVMWGSANLTPTALNNNAEFLMISEQPSMKCPIINLLDKLMTKKSSECGMFDSYFYKEAFINNLNRLTPTDKKDIYTGRSLPVIFQATLSDGPFSIA